ncbi:MAG: insulinase family protein [Clostridia bacterium]|nr:insulinase family protein [Clostridia bacterium]MCI8964917.1 insulinase family protein [Clostridia bacterium]
MQVIENDLIKEKVYIKKLKNGLTMMCIPKKNTSKKYIIFATNYGSMDDRFIVPGEENETIVPDGVAHFLEHKLFEQENGRNSLDVLSSLGVNANAYTTNNHTAYLYECTNNFYEALDEFMNYVQSPYFTDENVEKEKGIINQEIGMYDDQPEWKVYLNALEALYVKNKVKIDPAGTVQTVSKINKEILYKCYNNFYKSSNMVIVVSGNFEAEEIFKEIEKRVIKEDSKEIAKKVFEEEPEEVNKKLIKKNMDVNIPIFMLGIKCKKINSINILDNSIEQIRKHIAVDIILDIILGSGSKLYNELYDEGLIFSEFSSMYEYARDYSHILIQSQSYEYEKVVDRMKKQFEEFKNTGFNDVDFNRSKRKNYGMYVREFEDVESIGNNFVDSFFKGINPFDFIEESKNIDKEYVEKILKEDFKEDSMILSIITNK